MARLFSATQGRYLAYLYWYTKVNGRPPAEADLQSYFKTSPSAVHQMIVALEKRGLIARTPNQARSIRVLLSPEEIPDLDTGESPSGPRRSLAARFPNIAEWIGDYGRWIESGYDHNTSTFVRALDGGGMLHGGEGRYLTLDEAFQTLDRGIEEHRNEWA